MILALDTSTQQITLAIEKSGEIHTRTYRGKEKHAVKLAPILDDLLRSAGAKASDVDLIGLGVGPGSLTGLRIGIGLVIGLASVSGARVVPLNSFEVIAKGVSWSGEKVVVRKARKGYVYIQVFEKSFGPKVLSVEEASKVIGSLENPILIGDGKELFEGIKAGDVFDFPNPLVLLDMTKAGEAVDYTEVKPLYVQKSIAEINYERRMRDG